MLAIAGLGLWQLRLYGAPLTRSIQGTIGLDPLLVAAPAIGLLAGALFALRIIPLVAQLLERATTRGRGLVPSLGSRQLARRPLRYTRAALLLMLAMAIGVFAVSYTWTWTASQQDQATFQIGTDLRVQPGRQLGSRPLWGLDRAYAGVPGVTGLAPVERESVSLPGVAQAQALALDASAAPALVHLRPDLSAAPVAELMAPLAAARPSLEAVRLPGEPRALRLAVDLKIGQVERSEYDEKTKTFVFVPAEASEIAGWRGLDLSVVVRDARGLLHRFEGQRTTVDGGPHEMVVPLGPEANAAEATFAYPLDLLAIELLIRIPERYQVPNARVTVGDLARLRRPRCCRRCGRVAGGPARAVRRLAEHRRLLRPLAPVHPVDGVGPREVRLHLLGDLVGRLGPDLDELLATLIIGDQTALVLALDLGGLGPRSPRGSRACAAGSRRRRWRPWCPSGSPSGSRTP